MKRKKIETIAVEIPVDTVRRLLSANQLCAAELTCLDSRSQKALRRLCLETCMGLKCPMIWSQADNPVCPGHVKSALQADPESMPARERVHELSVTDAWDGLCLDNRR